MIRDFAEEEVTMHIIGVLGAQNRDKERENEKRDVGTADELCLP